MITPTDIVQLAACVVVPWIGTLTLTPVARRVALRWGVVDRPDGDRKLQRRPVALFGGTAVLLSLSIFVLAASSVGWFAGYSGRLPWLLSGLSLICLVGVCDDVVTLRARWKLLGQLGCTVPILCGGHMIDSISLLGYSLPLGIWAIPVSIAWLVAGMNAVNLIDGMDALASITGVCIALGVAAVGSLVGNWPCVLLALTLAGALAGFLAHNFPPAKIYLGDAGSMLIGLMLAVLTLEVGKDAAGLSHVTVMLALMAVPIGDTALAIVRRWMSGQGIWQADRGHIHHRLLDRGLSARGVLAIVVGLCLVSGTLAAVSRIIGWEPLAWGAGALLAAALVKSRLVGHHEWSLTKRLIVNRYRTARVALPTAQDLAAMPFDAAWQKLMAATETFAVRRLQVSVWESDYSARQHEWSPDSIPASTKIAALEITCGSAETGWCVLRAEPAAGLAGDPLQWSRLAQILWRYGQHWAAHPQTVPGQSLRIHRERWATTPLLASGERQIRAA